MPTIKSYIKRAQRRKNPMKFLFARFLWHTSIVRVIPIVIDRKIYKMRFFPSKLSADLWTEPCADRYEDKFLRAYLKNGDTVVDIGANVGTETLTAAAIVGNAGKVFAIEPQVRIFGYLERNIALNGFRNIELFNEAVDETERTISLSNSLLDTSRHVVDGNGKQIVTKKLDSLLDPFSLGAIHLVKIDVEGYEINVLKGAIDTLQKTHCVYFEYIPAYYRRYGYSEERIFDILGECGFRVYRPLGDEKNLLGIRNLEDFYSRTDNKMELEEYISVAEKPR